MHIEVAYLLLGIDRHVLVLLYGDMFIDFEHASVGKVHLDIFKAKYCLHRHE
jgi:hypothetical protein